MLVVIVLLEAASRVILPVSGTPLLRWQDYSTQLKVEQIEQRGPVEVVVVGTSMAQQDLVPAELSSHLDGAAVYNASLNGGVPQVMEPWLLNHVVPRLEPELVVWGLSPLDFSVAYGDATVQAYDDALATRSGWLADLERFMSPRFQMIAGRQALRDPDLLFGPGRAQQQALLARAEATLGVDGERLDFDTALGVDRAAEVSGRITPFRLDREDLAAIARTVTSLRADGIDVVFVELPVPDRFRDLYPGGPEQHALVGQAMRELGTALDVPVLSPPGPTADSDYVDFTHLAAEAATTYSTSVGQELRAVFLNED